MRMRRCRRSACAGSGRRTASGGRRSWCSSASTRPSSCWPYPCPVDRFPFVPDDPESALELADIALLVLDSSEPLTELDERIAGLAAKFELGVIIALNKWDKSEEDFDKFNREIRDKFKFLAYAPIISVSALGGKRVHKIYSLILEVYKNYTQKI